MSPNFLKNKWWSILWIRSEKKLIFFIICNFLISSIVGFFTPRVIVDFYQSLQNQEKFYDEVTFLLAILVIEYINRVFFQISTQRYIQLLVNQVRLNSFSLWLNSSFKKRKEKKVDDFPMGEVLARIMSDTDAIKEVVGSGSFGIFVDLIFVISSLISFLTFNSKAGVFVFLAEILVILALFKGSKWMATIFGEVRKITGKLARELTDITSGLKELSLTPNEHFALKRGEAISEEFLNKQLKANIWDASYYSAAESLYPILIALIMLLLPFSQIAEVAILAALIDLVQRSINPIKEVASKVSVIARAKTGIDRVQQFNNHFSEATEVRKLELVNSEVHKVHFTLSNFSYDAGFFLKNIDFELKKGEVLGIIGESGCGKSTLLKLLSGQFHTFDGLLKIDELEIDPKTQDGLKSYCHLVSLVSQDSHVFSDSIQFNISMGETQKSFEIFWDQALASIPYLHRWGIRPETQIKSKDLSLGQKQLLSGLRAFYLNRPIILLDEISSGLDSELELALRDLLNFLKKDCITIIVTHRLETILGATKLLLMEKGQVIGFGPFYELKENSKFKYFIEHLS